MFGSDERRDLVLDQHLVVDRDLVRVPWPCRPHRHARATSALNARTQRALATPRATPGSGASQANSAARATLVPARAPENPIGRAFVTLSRPEWTALRQRASRERWRGRLVAARAIKNEAETGPRGLAARVAVPDRGARHKKPRLHRAWVVTESIRPSRRRPDTTRHGFGR